MELREDEEYIELLATVIEALPRLKQYRLSEPQKVFIAWLENMRQRVEEAEMSELNLAELR